MTRSSSPGFAEASPLNIPKSQIFLVAEAVSRKVGYAPGDALEPIVERLGGEIGYLDYDDWLEAKSGSLEVFGKNRFKINISAFSGPLRNRFTIAHELGHYFLHSLSGEKKILIARKPGAADRLEWEANWFAAAFLMPEKEFNKVYQISGGDLSRIAGRFQVSMQAAQTRVKTLGLE